MVLMKTMNEKNCWDNTDADSEKLFYPFLELFFFKEQCHICLFGDISFIRFPESRLGHENNVGIAVKCSEK